jgi:hypothetical protein
VHGSAEGSTAVHDADLRNAASKLDRRLDYVFYESAEMSAVTPT